MEKIKEYFNALFGDAGILFPDQKQGIIRQKAGWVIGYIFGIENNKNYMEYYASHRMTDDRHYKIFGDGTIERLESIRSSYFYPKNATKEEIEKAEEKYFENNRRIISELKIKGLIE